MLLIAALGLAWANFATPLRAQSNVPPPTPPVTLMTRDPSRGWTTTPRAKAKVLSSTLKKPAATGAVPVTTVPGKDAGTTTAKAGIAVPNKGTSTTAAAASTAVPNKGAPTTAAAASTAVPNKGAPTTAAAASAAVPSKSAGTTAPPDAHANVQVKGLKGTLNKDDIHQTMDARQSAFDACIAQSRRSLRWINGAIRFACKVDAEGNVAELRVSASDIGHRALEQCLTAAVAATRFPKPAGHALAEFSWGMSVEPAGARALEAAEPKPFAKLARKQARVLFRACEIRRRRTRFQLTLYVTADGRLLSAGGVPVPARADDKLDCVLDQLKKWRMPKLDHASKVSFELR